MTKRNNRFKWLGILLLLLIVTGSFVIYKVFGPNTAVSGNEYLYIHTGSGFDDVMTELERGKYIRDAFSFGFLAKRANYPAHIRAGKYKISPGMSNYEMVRMLRSGRQEPVKLVINKLRTKEDFAKLVSANLEANADSIRYILNDSAYLAAYELNGYTAMCAIMPDTYEFYWNSSADKVFRKIVKNYLSYWNDERKQKAASKKLSQQQVITIASIIEEETNMAEDKPKIASVYLNRIKHGAPLQADPTLKFAVGDFTIRRISGELLRVQSPYNTYTNAGLPPGPICTPSKSSIEAVLNAPDTKYYYFCATPELDGRSVFAETLAEHQKNARAYQKALNERGIH